METQTIISLLIFITTNICIAVVLLYGRRRQIAFLKKELAKELHANRLLKIQLMSKDESNEKSNE